MPSQVATRTLVLVAVLAVVLALSSMQSAFAIKLSLDPTCVPPGTEVTLVVTEFTNYEQVEINFNFLSMSPYCEYDVNGLPTLTCVLYVPYTVRFPATVTVREGDESASVTFTDCPAVGGVVTPVNTVALVSPWLAVIGLVGCVTIVVVVSKKHRL